MIFTVLVPLVVGVYVPSRIYAGISVKGGVWNAGWFLIVLGAFVYGWCLISFLMSGGTPAIFFTRHLRFLIGEEPQKLVQQGLYRISRNPMYVGVLLVVFGQAVLFASSDVLWYGIGAWLFFHLVVVLLEEPHLRRERGATYDEYRREVPRWIGWPK